MKPADREASALSLRTTSVGERLPGAVRRAAAELEDRIARRILEAAGEPPISIVLWDGREVRVRNETPVARLHIRDRSTFYRLPTNLSMHFGDGFSAEKIEVEGDLVEFLEAVYRASRRGGRGRARRGVELGWVKRRHTPNTPEGSQENIHHHYDIGNDFYRLWLDREMVYTCAYYASPDLTLEQAQAAKMRHVCDKLRLQPDEEVVEAGCGWGALALFMARNFGVRVRAYNISKEQIAFARDRAHAEGLGGRVEFIETDYREISGRCDAFVSVGMLEHVGREHYKDLGGVIDRCLKSTGRGLLHTIGRNQPAPLDPWIERRVFPGGYPPTLREMMEVLEPWGFSVLDVENLRLHYAKTLQEWLRRYEASADRVRSMFGEPFLRAWRLYLSGSVAAFTTGGLQLFQATFARPSLNEIPWTREYLYQTGEDRGSV